MSQKHTSWVVKKNEINAVVTRWGAITPQVDVIRLSNNSKQKQSHWLTGP